MPFLSHHVGDGWNNIVDNPTEYQLVRQGQNGQPLSSGIYLFRNVAIHAANCDAGPEPGIGGTPEEMAAYLHDHPGLVTSEPEPVKVGGLGGVMIEVAIAPSWTTPCYYSEGQPTVPTFWGTDPNSGLEQSVIPGVKDRFYILAIPRGGNVLIDIGALESEMNFPTLMQLAAPVVGSITFLPSGDLSAVSPCEYTTDAQVSDVIAVGIGSGEEHLSALPGFWDCVFFSGNAGVVSVGVRQQPTAAATARELVRELFPTEAATPITVGRVPAWYMSCSRVWDPCRPAIAFGREPYFFVISVRTAEDAEDVAIALATAVLAKLEP